MADVSVSIGVNISFPYYGRNASTEILHGQLDSAHNSTLSGYWISYPTPWPYLLISIAISIGLGWLGFRSSAKSWRPIHNKGVRQKLLPQSDIEMSVTDDPMNPEHTVSHDEGKTLESPPQRAAEAKYAAEGETFDPEDDIRPDGGVGKFSMYKTIFGIGWTTVRSVSILALAVRTARSSASDISTSYPGPLSVMILFASAHTYLAGRGMPRIFNTLLAYDLVMIWVAFVIASFGHNSTVKYYGKIGVQGGNCPFFDRDKTNHHGKCNYLRWPQVGCATNSSWVTSEHHYPRAAWWFTGNPDPNTYGNSLLTLQLDFKLIGIAYGLIVLFLSLPMFFLPFGWRDLGKPLPAIKMAFLRRMSYTMSLSSFILVLVLSVIAIPLHLSTELDPPKYQYADSMGPLVNTSVFASETAETAIDRTWPSLAWNQSHEGTGSSSKFLGGNQTSWSDCFWVQPPKSKSGNLAAWWDSDAERALRVLAGL